MRMAAIIGGATERFQPDGTGGDRPGLRLDQRRLAAGVGGVNLGLPAVLWLFGSGACVRDSLSHYYFAPYWGAVFVAGLSFLATFLFAYRGDNRAEDAFTTLVAAATLVVALVPTTGTGCDGAAVAAGWTAADAPARGALHFWAAALLFAFLAFNCLVVFTRVVPGVQVRDGRLTPAKRARNRVYVACGIVILIAMAAMGLGSGRGWWDRANLTFAFEAGAMAAFGVAWLVKARAFGLRDPGEVTS